MQEINTQKLRNQLQKIADLGNKGIAEKQTYGGFLLEIHKTLLPENDDDYIFYKWLYKNRNHLREACMELGVSCPEGQGFYNRLKESIIPKLRKK